ncbi:jg26562, partial [Pararge aegeria aegeria]
MATRLVVATGLRYSVHGGGCVKHQL